MVKYKLVAINQLDRKCVIMEHTNLAKIDYFIYSSFKNNEELASYFKKDSCNFNIEYPYGGELKTLELIYSNQDKFFLEILKNVKKSKINIDNVCFDRIIELSLRKEYLIYLLKNKYIDKKTFNDLFLLLKVKKFHFDYPKDYHILMTEITHDLSSYIKFRRFYSGLNRCYIDLERIEWDKDERIKGNTDNEFVNDSFRIGGLDEVYSCYDLDDLNRIGKSYTLKIDGIKKK